jgi:hypothetical protein
LSRSGAVVALALAAALAAPTQAAPATGPVAKVPAAAAPRVRAATTGRDSELVKTIAITRRRHAGQRVAMSLTPARLGTLDAGERLLLNGEVQVTLTCARPGLRRCIGRSYSFSPRVEARLVLAAGERVAAGRDAAPLSTWGALTCSAHLPNRNHHCVVVFPRIAAEIGSAGELPCAPRRCFVNLVLAAHSPHARRGDRLIVGTDRPDGSVAQDKGRLNAVEIQPGAEPAIRRSHTRRRRARALPVHENGGRRVVYSVRLPPPRRGDVLAVYARQITDIGRLPYSAYVSDEIILAPSPRAVRPSRSGPGAEGGHVTAANGFNCTQGPSQFQTPCVSSKAGVTAIRRSGNRPLYVNLVSRSKPKHTGAAPGDEARIARGGALRVIRYRPARSASSRVNGSSTLAR